MAKKVPGQTKEQKLVAYQRKAAALRHQISQQRRKDEARRKIVIGGTVELAIADNSELRKLVLELLRQSVTRPDDVRVVADLLEEAASAAPSPSADHVRQAVDQTPAETREPVTA